MASLKGDDGVPSGSNPNNLYGVWGDSGTQTIQGGGYGVVGISRHYSGVAGITLKDDINAAGVYGRGRIGVTGEVNGAGSLPRDPVGVGVFGSGSNSSNLGGTGVLGVSDTSRGVAGESTSGPGVYGRSEQFDGVKGESFGPQGAGVSGYNPNDMGVWAQGGRLGIWAQGGEWAGQFEGSVYISKDVSIDGHLYGGNGDCAEDFDIAEENVETGTVMVLNDMGSLQASYKEYDKRVAGIISGAGGRSPAIILDRQQSETQNQKKQSRLPIALMGKVYCKVDATNSSIEIGDLLTTSSKKGYAMKAEDPMKAFGTVIGKALGSIKEGLGMIPVLVALQ